MPRKRSIAVPKRPVLLGTDETPPPFDVSWQMWSQSSSPYEVGLVQFKFTPKGLAVQWWGPHEERYVIEWHELAAMAALPPKLAEEVQSIKENAAIEGRLYGLAEVLARYGNRTEMPAGKPILTTDSA